jgi:lipopolysaccharide/colanic/teichoic acid biosynthesis glycosyltransferase
MRSEGRGSIGEPPKARLSKRIFDLFLASVALILFAPLILLIMFAVTIDGGPALVSRRWVGADGGGFRGRQFRCTTQGAASAAYPGRASTPQTTSIGRVLQETEIEKLPLLINILMGDMSFVGPRPIEEAEIDEHDAAALEAYYACRPALTGLWRIGNANIANSRQLEQLDRRYASEWSLWSDLVILIKATIVIALPGDSR